MKTTLTFHTDVIPSVTRKDLLEQVLSGKISQGDFYSKLEESDTSAKEIRVLLGEMFAQVLTSHLTNQ